MGSMVRTPVVAAESFSEPVRISGTELAQLAADRFRSSIELLGYELAACDRRDLSVGFVDGSDVNPPLGQLLGIEDQIRKLGLPTVAAITIPTLRMGFEQGALTLQVDYNAVSSTLAREWVRHVVEGLAHEASTSLGEVFVGGPGFVIDAGDELIGGTWSDGQPVSDGHDLLEDRLVLHVETAREIAMHVAARTARSG